MTTGSSPRTPTSMGELLGAFAFASDLAFGLQLEDGLRSCYLAMSLAKQMGASEEEQRTVYYTALLKDAGCTSWTGEFGRFFQADEIVARREFWIFMDRTSPEAFESWMREYVAPDVPQTDRNAIFEAVTAGMSQQVVDAVVNTAEVAGRIARRLGMPRNVIEATHHLFEQWDGGGAPRSLKGDEIPITSRIVLPSFIVVPVHRLKGREAALDAVRRYRGMSFDPAVLDALEAIATSEDFWEGLEGDGIRERVLALEPRSELSEVGSDRIEDIAIAFADFIDLKSRFAGAHSRRVAKISEQLALYLGCAPEAVVQIRRAALMHDLGLVAIPSFSLEKPEQELSDAEAERYRLHPYHGERILQRVPAMAPYAEMVGNHQERLDGSGYFRGLRGPSVSLGARIIAVADRIDELTHDAPGRPALPLRDAIAELETDRGLDGAVIEVLRRAIGEPAGATVQQRPAGLTAREVEVLQLAARGLTRGQIGLELRITENTVRHHLEHIYNKTGTSTRVGATLFAIENGLLG